MTRFLAACVALCATFLAPPADALVCGVLGCTCNVSATTLDFGSMSPLDGAQTAEGEVTIDCTGLAELFPSILVEMQSGVHGTINARKMQSSSGDLLDYNIYTTDQHVVVWGNGTTGGSAVNVSGGILALGHWTVDRTFYGVVGPTTATRPGSYSDTVIVRIDW
ncbi:MAG: spore coat protein U domain-containing protein [Hyphomonadaceae bacterium]